MKLIAFLFILFSFNAISQDTSDVYVINNTNRLVSVESDQGTGYVFFYRNLSKIGTTDFIPFEDNEAMISFFNTCLRSLDEDKLLMTQGYSISRNKLSKKVAKVRKKDGGYFLLKRDTLDAIRDAYARSVANE